ncbi:MAG: hypothetical protein K6E20_04740 [Acholeplasmatales bacterium]|nr:hypothetical protein [Acholeplasmatales bacterium]
MYITFLQVYTLSLYEKIMFIIPIMLAAAGLFVAFMVIYHKNVSFISKSRWKYLYFFIPAFAFSLITFFAVTDWNKLTVLLKIIVLIIPVIEFGIVNWVTVRNKAAI